jgi:hypothetical protein
MAALSLNTKKAAISLLTSGSGARNQPQEVAR